VVNDSFEENRMATVLGAIGGATVVMLAISPAYGQERTQDSGMSSQNVRYDITSPISPS
jgi:hypothetical protein